MYKCYLHTLCINGFISHVPDSSVSVITAGRGDGSMGFNELLNTSVRRTEARAGIKCERFCSDILKKVQTPNGRYNHSFPVPIYLLSTLNTMQNRQIFYMCHYYISFVNSSVSIQQLSLPLSQQRGYPAVCSKSVRLNVERSNLEVRQVNCAARLRKTRSSMPEGLCPEG